MEDFWHPHTSVASLAKRVWVHGFLAGLGVVAAAFLVWVMVRGIHAPPALKIPRLPFPFPRLSPTRPRK
jgi:hypothetical protein